MSAIDRLNRIWIVPRIADVRRVSQRLSCLHSTAYFHKRRLFPAWAYVDPFIRRTWNLSVVELWNIGWVVELQVLADLWAELLHYLVFLSLVNLRSHCLLRSLHIHNRISMFVCAQVWMFWNRGYKVNIDVALLVTDDLELDFFGNLRLVFVTFLQVFFVIEVVVGILVSFFYIKNLRMPKGFNYTFFTVFLFALLWDDFIIEISWFSL